MMSRLAAGRQHRLAVITLIVCAFLWSTAGVATRHLERVDGFELTFWRSLSCGLFVSAWLIGTHGPRWLAAVTASGVPGVVSGLMWAIMFTCFMVALTLTTVAKTVAVMAVAPLVTALLAWLVLNERIAARTWLAVLVAGAGIVWMVRDGLQSDEGSGSLWGMLVAAGVPLASAVNLVNMKHQQARDQQARVDLVPALLVGAIFSCLAMLPFVLPAQASGRDILVLSTLGVFQLGLPCILMIRAARHLSPQETALLSLLEVVFGPLWAWLGVGERPTEATLYGACLIVAALVANELFAFGRPRPPAAGEPAAGESAAGDQAVRIAKSKPA
jgi:drug/metabolite transporter (DMT)-like permease